MVKVGVVGAAGYAGSELVKILIRHPQVKLACLADQAAGEIMVSGKKFIVEKYDPAVMAEKTEIVFLALPHTVSIKFAPELLKSGKKVIDLSADFRLKDVSVYKEYYKHDHDQPDLLKQAVYGLPEIYRAQNKQNFCIVVVAEGAKPKGHGMFTKEQNTTGRQEVLLGGIAEWVANEITKITGKESRSLVLGHLQRGGNPTTFDRLLATRFGAAAIRAIQQKRFGEMVCLRPPNVLSVPLEEAIGKMKSVPLDSDEIMAGRELGICFGD